MGHEAGVGALRECVKCCVAWGIPALTVYAFSAENWGRGPEEVAFLMRLIARELRDTARELREQGVRLHFLGDVEALPDYVRREVRRAEAATSHGAALHLRIALNHSGRSDLARAARSLAEAVASGTLSPAEVDEAALGRALADLRPPLPPAVPPEPDLLIRTSGEQRLSNFLLWELAYAELHFAEPLWPDFGEAELRAACHVYAGRQRRFGRRPA